MPMRALVLVDLQYDFLPGGALAVPRSDEVIPVALRMIPKFPLVVATQDWHPRDHKSFAVNNPGTNVGQVIQLEGIPQVMWPAHCVQGTRGAELHDELPGDLTVFRKGTDPAIDSYSGFFDNGHKKATGLAQWLDDHGATELFVLGLATDYCVKFTVLDARSLGYSTTLVEDGCRAVELSPGDSAHAIKAMRDVGATIIDSSQL